MHATPAIGLLAVLALGASGCGGSAEKADFAHGGTYTERVITDPGNLNPLQAQQQTTNAIVPFAYDSLINVDSRGRVIPQLATAWKVTPTRVTFTLRKGVTCADGSPLRARDVAATFTYIKAPRNHSSMLGTRLPSADFTVRSDDAAGTVAITLPSAYGFLLTGAGLVPIVCAKGLADPARLAHHTMGTGPFNVTDYVADDHLTLVRRKGYRWGPGGASTSSPGFPDKVVFRVVQDETTAANLLLSGQLNSDTVSGPETARLEGHGFQRLASPGGPGELWFNQRRGHPGADPAVRTALTSALDLDQLTKVVSEGTGRRASSLAVNEPRPCPAPTVPGTLPAHDLAAAKTALDQAGWTEGAGGVRSKDGQPLRITLLYGTADQSSASGMELVRQWWRQLGADVKLLGQSSNGFPQTLFAGTRWDVAWLTIGIAAPSEFTAFATGPASPKGQNFAAVTNADYRKLAGRALGTPGAAGCRLWGQAEQALFRDLDVVPVAESATLTFMNKARIAEGVNGTEPTSIRLLAG